MREEPLGDEGQKSFAVLVEDESLDYFVQFKLDRIGFILDINLRWMKQDKRCVCIFLSLPVG